jgi:hypothetical protein
LQSALRSQSVGRTLELQNLLRGRDDMRSNIESSLRRSFLRLTATAAGLGALVGLPVKNALAQPQKAPATGQPPAAAHPPAAKLEVIQPKSVHSSTQKLLQIADQAMSDNALAGRISREPDAVAKQFNLSDSERAVLRHMNSSQFEAARRDSAQLVQKRMASGQPMPPGATNTKLITEQMVVGRAILAAVGKNYLTAAKANECCPWGHSIEVGVAAQPAAYDAGFRR